MAAQITDRKTVERPGPCHPQSPRRNRYFYGKLLDAEHFELETDYLNGKRWLINRLVIGYGVVCGLDVKAVDGDDAVVIQPGVAIDKHGREIIVPEPTPPIVVPDHLKPPDGSGEKEEEDEDDKNVVHVLLCYHECPVEPAPVMAGGCHDPEPCEAGVILERYKVLFRAGCAPKAGGELRIPDVISGSTLADAELDYDRLVAIVSEPCPPCPPDPCIPLAEIRFEDGHCNAEEIDITVRPIVFTNDLLFQLILSMIQETPSYRREK